MHPSDIKRMLGREVFWYVPYDESINTSSQLGTPLVVAKPTARAAESILRMAVALSGARTGPPSQGKPPRPRGIISRILNRAEERSGVKVSYHG